VKRLLGVFATKHQPDATRLSAYLDGEMPPPERAALEAHLASCGACSARLSELRDVRSMLASMPQVAPRRSFRVREADLRPRAAYQQPFLLRAMPALSAAAVLVFGVVLAVDLRGDDSDNSAPGTAMIAGQGESRAAYDEAAPDADRAPRGMTGGDAAEGPGDEATSDTATPPNAAAAAPAETAPVPATGGGSPAEDASPDRDERIEALADDGDGGNNVALRIVEVVAGVTALAAAAIALVAWRRRKGDAAHGPT